MPSMERNGIKKAIECLGSQSALAQALGVTPQFISQLANGSRPVPAKLVRKIETATDGQVSCHDLRPDIFGETIVQNVQVA
jgi:DNA-binding transcriptional regulator YdaS (Cro superfamily)